MVQLIIQRGIKGLPLPNGNIPLDDDTVGITSEWAGSFHILSMGLHHRSYLAKTFPQLVRYSDFPVLEDYQNLPYKNPSQQVIGNFGECIGAIFAHNRLDVPICNIIHLTTRRAIKRPDYIMKLDGANIRNIFSGILPPEVSFPYLSEVNWWPVESKATARSGTASSQKEEALTQLLTFWKNESEQFRLATGYGMILTYQYNAPATIIASLILPRDQGKLIECLANEISSENTEKNEYYQRAMRCLYDCS